MNPVVPLVNPESVISILSQISIFGGTTEAQQSEIFRRLEVSTCKKGEFVFEKGDEPSHIYIIKSGLIELFIPDKAHIIEKKRLGVGESFGQVAVMSIHQHTISALALDDSSLIVLSRRALYGLHHEDLPLFALLMMNIARELARRLQFMDELLLRSVHIQGQTVAPAASSNERSLTVL